ncbi:MAG: AsmA family protein [Paludibacteraceae bacterium]|nr:AsmA family protein [Paludibacteraceae bacterium]
MKKLFKIAGIVLAVFVALLLLLPYAIQGKLKDVAISEANKMLDAEIYMGDLSLSFFRDFPHASVGIENFGVAGVDTFANDTLLDVKRMYVVLNIASLFSDSYEINKVELIDATAKAKVLENGKANWDILGSLSDTTETVEEDTSAASPFGLSLESVKVENLNVKFIDKQSKMFAAVSDFDLYLEGDMAQGGTVDMNSLANVDVLNLAIGKVAFADKASALATSVDNVKLDFSGSVSDAAAKLKTALDIDALSLYMDKIPYLSKAKIDADVDIDADLSNNKFVFSQNSVALNEIKAQFDGFVHLVDSATIDMDLALKTPDIDFKQILSLIPAVYAKDFASLKTAGDVKLSAVAKGRMQGENLPAFDVNLEIIDAMLKYPDLPSDIKGVDIKARATNPGGVADLTVIDVPSLKFNMAGNPFEARVGLKTPVSDPDFDFGAKGKIDLGKLKDVVPLDSMSMNGVLVADLDAKGKLSYVENEQFDKFAVAGNLNLADMLLEMQGMPYDVKVAKANLDFATAFVNLTDLDVKLGKNDIQANGKLENFIPYLFKDETIKGKLAVSSNYFNLNDFITEDTSASEVIVEDEDTTSMTVIEIPANIDFEMDVKFNELVYDKIVMNNASGELEVKDQVVNIKNLSTDAFGGKLALSGAYSTKNVNSPKVDLKFNMKNMSISKVFSGIETLKAFVPALSDADGDFSMGLDFSSLLGSDMMPDLASVSGLGDFESNEVKLKGVKALDNLADKLNIKELKNPAIKDLIVGFKIKDGRMETEPFDAKVGSSKLVVSGSSGLDQTLDYVTTVEMPNETAPKLPLKFDVKIGGTFTDPKISVSAKSTTDAVKDVVKDKVNEVVYKVALKNLENAKATQKKMMAEAEANAEKMRKAAAESGQKLVDEAQKQSDKMVAGAKNKLDKIAKQKAGDALVKEAKKKADKLNKDAEANANKLISSTKEKTDKMVKEAESKVK